MLQINNLKQLLLSVFLPIFVTTPVNIRAKKTSHTSS